MKLGKSFGVVGEPLSLRRPGSLGPSALSLIFTRFTLKLSVAVVTFPAGLLVFAASAPPVASERRP